MSSLVQHSRRHQVDGKYEFSKGIMTVCLEGTGSADSAPQAKGQQGGLGAPRGLWEEVPGLVPARTELSPLWKPPWP